MGHFEKLKIFYSSDLKQLLQQLNYCFGSNGAFLRRTCTELRQSKTRRKGMQSNIYYYKHGFQILLLQTFIERNTY